jgi:hypothetical protein
MYFCKKKVKIEVCFQLWNSRQVFHDLPSSRYVGPRKIRCYKVAAVRTKTSPRTLAARRLVPRYATKKNPNGNPNCGKIRQIQDTSYNI